MRSFVKRAPKALFARIDVIVDPNYHICTMRIPTALAVIVVLLLGQTVYSVDTRTYREGRAFVTEGTLDNVLWYPYGKQVISDFACYDNWALKGLDGKDPISANYWEQFVSFAYNEPGRMTLVYNINMPWPFGSKNNKLQFRVDDSRLDQDILTMTVLDKPLGIESASFIICAEDSPTHPGSKIVRFKTALTFAWFIERFLNVQGYTEHMQTVMSLLACNLEEYSVVSAAMIQERAKGTVAAGNL